MRTYPLVCVIPQLCQKINGWTCIHSMLMSKDPLCLQGHEPPPRQRGIGDLLAMLSAQMTPDGAAEEREDGQEAHPSEGMQPGQTLPSMDSLEEGASLVQHTVYCLTACMILPRSISSYSSSKISHKAEQRGSKVQGKAIVPMALQS